MINNIFMTGVTFSVSFLVVGIVIAVINSIKGNNKGEQIHTMNSIPENQNVVQPVGVPSQPQYPYPMPQYVAPAFIPKENIRKTRINELKALPSDEKRAIVVIFTILLSVFFVDSISRTLGGFGSTLMFFSSQILLWYLFIQKGKGSKAKFLFLSIPILLTSLPFSLFTDSKGYFIPYMTLFVLLGLQIILLSGISPIEVFSVESIALLLRRIIAVPIGNLNFFFKSLRIPKGNRNGKLRNLVLAFAGLLLAIPFLFLLIELLTKADPIFKNMYDNFIKNLHLKITFGRFFSDIFLGFLLAIFSGAAIVYNLVDDNPEMPLVKQPTLSPILGFSFTLVLNILLGIFSFVQIKYLFIGNTYNEIIEKIGYSQYAREGFFELCYASSIVFVLAILVLALCKKNDKNPIYIRISIIFMSLFSGVLAVSSVKRMMLYIFEHGLSVKRVSTLFGTTVILTALFWLLVKCIFTKLKAIKTIGISIVVLVMLFSYVNIDRLVSSYNTNKYISGELTPDIEYYKQLSYTAVVDAAKLYNYATEMKRAQFPPVKIRRLETFLFYAKKDFDNRDLFSYTVDDIKIKEAFESLPTEILPD